jgi:PEP-CTERM motif-containing protein
VRAPSAIVFGSCSLATRRPSRRERAASFPSAGSPTNGVYKSLDASLTWNRINGSGSNVLPTSDLGRIAISMAPSQPSTLYVAVASASSQNLLGLFKTVDAGQNWNQLPNTPQFCDAQCGWDIVVTVDPNNSNIVFAGGAYSIRLIRSIAATPDGSHVYAVYGKQDATSVDRLYLATFTTIAGNLVENPGAGTTPFSIAGQRSALPSIAIAANGTIAVLYQTTPSTNNFEVHLAMSLDLGLTFTDKVLTSYNTSNIPLQFGSSRLLGDYEHLTAMGNTFYGTFPATGDVNSGGINTTGIISPYFFLITVPEPSSLGLVVMGVGMLLGTFMRVRR